MDVGAYAVESEVEQTHWWFVVRRDYIRSAIELLRLPSDVAVLDVGTSTGTNLRLLREMGFNNFVGLDLSPNAIEWCQRKGLGQVHLGDVCALPFADESFDLVLATDIIEHVEDDARALSELRRILKRTGRIIITVPTFQSLWGLQDQVAHHKRRYRREELLAKLQNAGFHCVKSRYFNFLLFVPIWLARRVIRLFGIRLQSENQINTPILNRILKRVFALDVVLAEKLNPPFGVSMIVLARCLSSGSHESSGIDNDDASAQHPSGAGS